MNEDSKNSFLEQRDNEILNEGIDIYSILKKLVILLLIPITLLFIVVIGTLFKNVEGLNRSSLIAVMTLSSLIYIGVWLLYMLVLALIGKETKHGFAHPLFFKIYGHLFIVGSAVAVVSVLSSDKEDAVQNSLFGNFVLFVFTLFVATAVKKLIVNKKKKKT